MSADAGRKPNESTVNEDTSDEETLTEDQQVKKKQKREKVGFRDRKVIACFRLTFVYKSFEFIYGFFLVVVFLMLILRIIHVLIFFSHLLLIIYYPPMWNQIILDIQSTKKTHTKIHIHDARSLSMKIECAHFQRPIKYSDILLQFELLHQIPLKFI